MTKGTGNTESSIQAEGIPVRKVIHSDSAQIPHPYSQTPNGTIFSTTPGGTRIIYDRSFLMSLRNSPHSRSPPKGLKVIPGITKNEEGKIIEEDESTAILEDDDGIPRRSAHPVLVRDVSNPKDDTQFQMEM